MLFAIGIIALIAIAGIAITMFVVMKLYCSKSVTTKVQNHLDKDKNSWWQGTQGLLEASLHSDVRGEGPKVAVPHLFWVSEDGARPRYRGYVKIGFELPKSLICKYQIDGVAVPTKF